MMTNDEVRTAIAGRDRIKRAVRMLCDAFGRKLSDEALDTWAERLEPYAGRPLLWRVLKDAVAWEQWPNLGTVLSKVQSEIKHGEATKLPPPLSERERQRADHAAIMSMLSLHYEQHWRLEDFSGHILGRCFGRDPFEALRAAKLQYDRESVQRWMADALA